MLMKKLFCFFIFCVISSCTHMAPYDTKRGNRFYDKKTNGILIYSFSKTIPPNSEVYNYALLIQNENSPSTYIYYLDSKFSKRFHYEENESEIKYLNSSTLPAGKYFIKEFIYFIDSKDYKFLTNIPFEIKAKQITYIGNFESLLMNLNNVIKNEMTTEQLYKIENLIKSDSISYYKNFHLPHNIPLNVQINNPLKNSQ